MNKDINVLGIMSGTSLDGIDLALVRFSPEEEFELLATKSVNYANKTRKRMTELHLLPGEDLMHADRWFGRFLGEEVNLFRRDFPDLDIDIVSSHGHTVFHQPAHGLTVQIGHGFALSAACGLPVVCDFRTLDLALGGQGAPLVPRGDIDLFPNYKGWMNLGGMANITINRDGAVLAWDLAPCNTVFNMLSARMGLEYDANGTIAASGKCIASLQAALRNLPYFTQKPPKTLGREWVESNVFPLLDEALPEEDLLHTSVVTLAECIVQQIPKDVSPILLSGGGAKNGFLVESLQNLRPNTFVVAPKKIVDFKEAIIFAYLGYLKWIGKPNVLASVTGASHDHIGGVLYDAAIEE